MMTDFELIEAQAFDGTLGANCDENGTGFRVWQPLAERIELRLYGEDGSVIKNATMSKNNGVFECRMSGDLDGVYYTFAVTRNGETVECADPYAKSVTADGERSIVTDMHRHAPNGWENDRPMSFGDPEKAVIYELSVRDFSMDESADFKNRGKFAAFCEDNVVNSHGDSVGLPYMQKLGVTHIQIMPVFDFDMDGGEYNWGYNPRFYNAPSAYYSQEDGVKELREFVATAHKKELGVVADVVYNHVFDVEKSPFEKLFPGYYFRTDKDGKFSNGSGCGNEFASERKMARKFIVDSLVFLASEYHLDGFRFDLMGLLDIETLKIAESKLRAINPDILLYGEGWTGGASPFAEERRAVLGNARELPSFAFFNDRFRDAVKGSVFNAADCGYVNGAADDWHFEPIRAAFSGKFSEDFWTDDPRQTVNYVECHDNLTLYDKLDISLDNEDMEHIECVKLAGKTAAALVLLSRGMAFIQAGQEFLRSKNGEHNTYNLPDSVNSLKWDKIAENRDIVEYYRGLITFRRRFLGELAKSSECVFESIGGGFMMTAGEFVLLVSPTDEELHPNLSGTFEVYADRDRASDKPLYTVNELCCAEYSILLARRD